MSSRDAMVQYIESGDLEAAADLWGRTAKGFDSAVFDRRLDLLEEWECDRRAAGKIREANRLMRMHLALKIFREHGLDVGRLLLPVRLPEDRDGKILLLTVTGGAADGNILLRGGDEWHREILRDARHEVADLGFSRARVDPAGGAWVEFRGEDAISIWGESEEFGACNRHDAADMIRAAYPGRRVHVLD